MKCPICNNDTLFLVDGKCKKCPEESEQVKESKRGNNGRTLSKCQRASTTALIARCEDLMSKLGLRPYKFAEAIDVTPSAFYRWLNGTFSVHWQLKFNEKVLRGLECGTFIEICREGE